MDAPKVFISYAWSTAEHEHWVIGLAKELCESGVDVILDKWALREGHDKFVFMEQMVTNASIKKVVMICDRAYASKADDRAGGVGTETQIISREVYEKTEQDKFVAVIREGDENGKPYLPTYYQSRIYIDLSTPDQYTEEFEKLVRWAFDKPLYVKPELGAPPEYLREQGAISLGTGAVFRRCTDAIRGDKPHALGALDEYCAIFAKNLEKFRLSKPEGQFDDAVMKSIGAFTPYRDEVVQLVTAIARYTPRPEFVNRIHRLLENLIPYLQRPDGMSAWMEHEFDNFRFFIRELFLYVLASFIRAEHFEAAATLLSQQFYVDKYWGDGRNRMVGFQEFWQPIKSLEHRNHRLSLRKLSITAFLLEQRCHEAALNFRDLMQADFVAFMRAELEGTDAGWLPETLAYLGYTGGSTFEIFARSVSRMYFDRVKVLLGINTPKDLEPLWAAYREGKRQLPMWRTALHINPPLLLGYEALASRA